MEESWCKLKLNPPHKFIDLQPINSIDFQSATRPAMEAEAPGGRERSARPRESGAPGKRESGAPAGRDRSGRLERAERPAGESGAAGH